MKVLSVFVCQLVCFCYSVYMCNCLCVYVCVYIYLSVYIMCVLSVYIVCLSVCLSVCLPVCFSVCLSVCLASVFPLKFLVSAIVVVGFLSQEFVSVTPYTIMVYYHIVMWSTTLYM